MINWRWNLKQYFKAKIYLLLWSKDFWSHLLTKMPQMQWSKVRISQMKDFEEEQNGSLNLSTSTKNETLIDLSQIDFLLQKMRMVRILKNLLRWLISTCSITQYRKVQLHRKEWREKLLNHFSWLLL